MASDVDVTDEQMQQAKEDLRERYRDETGHELPEHVVENLELLSSMTLHDIAEMQERQRRASKEIDDDGLTTAQVYLFMGEVAISGLVGVLASNFFDGLGSQLAGGFFTALLAFVVIGSTVYWAAGDSA
jgi:hypothetical protein